MPFVIKTKDDAYIRQDIAEFETTTNSDFATKWKTETAAGRILSQIKRKPEFFLSELRIERFVYTCPEEPETISSEDSARPNTDFDVVEKAQDFITYANKLSLKKEELIEQQRQIEREIVDIEHAIEFHKLNAAEGYKMYRLLHDTRVARRSIKNQLTVIDSLMVAVNSDQVERVARKIENISTRRYIPRTDLELFDDNE